MLLVLFLEMFTEETKAQVINHGSRMSLRLNHHPNADVGCTVRFIKPFGLVYYV